MSTAEEKPMLVLVIGPPAAGKGTLCRRIQETARSTSRTDQVTETGSKVRDFFYDTEPKEPTIQYLSVGDYLREIVERGTPDADLIGDFIREQRLLPDYLLIPIIKRALETSEGAKIPRVILIDGFPRDVEHCDHFEEEIGVPDLVIYLECSKQIARNRFMNRGRGFDNEAVFERRWTQSQEALSSIADRYQHKWRCIETSAGIEAWSDAWHEFNGLPCFTVLSKAIVETTPDSNDIDKDSLEPLVAQLSRTNLIDDSEHGNLSSTL